MKKKNRMPSKGQFVAVWEFDDKIWSQTFKYKKRVLKRFSSKKDKFVKDEGYTEMLQKSTFFKIK